MSTVFIMYLSSQHQYCIHNERRTGVVILIGSILKSCHDTSIRILCHTRYFYYWSDFEKFYFFSALTSLFKLLIWTYHRQNAGVFNRIRCVCFLTRLLNICGIIHIFIFYYFLYYNTLDSEKSCVQPTTKIKQAAMMAYSFDKSFWKSYFLPSSYPYDQSKIQLIFLIL